MSFYDGKKVLVCGASGMTGHNLYDYLQAECSEVTGTCLNNNDYYTDGSPMFISVDFTDKDKADKFFSNKKFDLAFICCAQTYNAQMCIENPQSMVLPNIQMVSNILENCLRTGVKRVLYISSATVYQPSFKCLSEEDLDLNKEPNPLYAGVGWAKRYMEKLCEFYSGLGLDVVVVRPTNIYGRYDKTDSKYCHVIPALVMRALSKPREFVVYGNGMAVKNFIYVNDFVRDLLRIMESYKTPDPINLCSDEEISIEHVVYNILRNFRGYHPRVIFTSKEVDQVPYRGISRSKCDALFGKMPYKSIEEGIQETIEWYSLLRQTQN
jgi:GDP-L-fucose synthase